MVSEIFVKCSVLSWNLYTMRNLRIKTWKKPKRTNKRQNFSQRSRNTKFYVQYSVGNQSDSTGKVKLETWRSSPAKCAISPWWVDRVFWSSSNREFASTPSASKNCSRKGKGKCSIPQLHWSEQYNQNWNTCRGGTKPSFHTSFMEIELEEAKAEISSRAAVELALCSLTTFCMSSKWVTYKALEALIFLFKPTTAYKKTFCINSLWNLDLQLI